MDSKLRIVGKTGVMYRGHLFTSPELLKHIGEKVVIDDLGVLDSSEIIVQSTKGIMLCFAERTDGFYRPFYPQKLGAFERAVRRLACLNEI